MTYTGKIKYNIYYLFCIYFLAIVTFSLFRIVLLLTNLDQVNNIGDGKWSLLVQALWMGVRFDTVISCYILLLPVVVIFVLLWFGKLTPTILSIGNMVVTILFSVSFLLCTIDIPFFNKFFTRLNSSMFTWIDQFGIVVGMIIKEPRFMLFVPVFVVLISLYVWFMRRIWKSHTNYLPVRSENVAAHVRVSVVLLSILLWGVIFLGIRGRISKKSPIRVGTAYFSNNPFINQLGLNPVYSLMRSCMDAQKADNQKLDWIQGDEANAVMSGIMGDSLIIKSISPVARWQSPRPIAEGYNLVLVIMESMSAGKMGYFGNPNGLTPFLDSLANQSYFFNNFYSAGIHTYNGIYSTLFGHPALLSKHPMYEYFADKMAGLPNILRKAGYQTAFFIPHDDQFDNVGGFLSANDMQKIYSQKDYPAGEANSSMGVPDEFMFRYAIPELNGMSEREQPFFVAMMTISDHEPYILPENIDFEPKSEDLPQQMIEYADWSLMRLMQYASRQPWYQRTVFAFVADHGGNMGVNTYDISLEYHHIPFMIYMPGIQPKVFEKLGTQVDITPTLSSLLGIRFVNNTFGIDLLNEDHRCLVFSSDNNLACMNDSLLFLYSKDLPDRLHFYRDKDAANYSEKYPDILEEMKRTGFSWLQTSQWMIDNRKTRTD